MTTALKSSFLFFVIPTASIIVGLGLILYGAFFYSPYAALDIQVHDNYIVIPKRNFTSFFGFLLLLKNSLIIIFHKRISLKKWTTLHLVIDGLALAVFVYFMTLMFGNVPRRYYRFDTFETFSPLWSGKFTLVVTVVFLLNQLFALGPLLAIFFSKKRTISGADILDN